LNVSKNILHKYLKLGLIRRHSSDIKLLLKEENKKVRFQICLSMLDGASLPHDPDFSRMYIIIYIYEKWFYMMKKCEDYYLVHDEEEPMRTCKSKSLIEKVKFLVDIARPRFDANGNEIFYGKIGVFPLVTQVPAKRNSINKAAKTLETKQITSVTKQVIRSCLIEEVLLVIKKKWPREEKASLIFIQQDNVRTHIDCDDEKFCRVASQDGFNICLMCQPTNSPDLNVLDLGYFSAIQLLRYKEAPNSVDELLKAVAKSFEAFSMKSNRIFFFLTFKVCMIEIMKKRGYHKYKIQHKNKNKDWNIKENCPYN
jgi:hypothetical protein